MNKEEAQRRVDRVSAFRAELAELEREGVRALAGDDREEVFRHQDALFEVRLRYGRRYEPWVVELREITIR